MSDILATYIIDDCNHIYMHIWRYQGTLMHFSWVLAVKQSVKIYNIALVLIELKNRKIVYSIASWYDVKTFQRKQYPLIFQIKLEGLASRYVRLHEFWFRFSITRLFVCYDIHSSKYIFILIMFSLHLIIQVIQIIITWT